jgi:hypothetical protein
MLECFILFLSIFAISTIKLKKKLFYYTMQDYYNNHQVFKKKEASKFI